MPQAIIRNLIFFLKDTFSTILTLSARWLFLKFLKFDKTNFGIARVDQCPKTVDQNCRPKLSTKTVDQNCRQKLSTKTVDKNCRQKLSTKIVDKNCHQKLSTKTVEQNCRSYAGSVRTSYIPKFKLLLIFASYFDPFQVKWNVSNESWIFGQGTRLESGAVGMERETGRRTGGWQNPGQEKQLCDVIIDPQKRTVECG